jgi:hypothetical protein
VGKMVENADATTTSRTTLAIIIGIKFQVQNCIHFSKLGVSFIVVVECSKR